MELELDVFFTHIANQIMAAIGAVEGVKPRFKWRLVPPREGDEIPSFFIRGVPEVDTFEGAIQGALGVAEKLGITVLKVEENRLGWEKYNKETDNANHED